MAHPTKPAGKTAGRFARWSLIILANLAILLVVGISTVRETYQGWKVDQEMRDLQSQVDQLQGKHLDLSQVIRKLSAVDSVDEEARARLGMQKPGEKVVVLQGTDVQVTDDSRLDAVPSQPSADNKGNPQKWFEYFFTH